MPNVFSTNLEAFWGHLGFTFGHLGANLGHFGSNFWVLMGQFRALVGHFGALGGQFGVTLSVFCTVVSDMKVTLQPFWPVFMKHLFFPIEFNAFLEFR